MLLVPRRRYLVAADVVIALALAAVVGYAAIDASTAASPVEPRWLSYLTAVVVAGPIAVRRLAPLPALAVSVGGELVAVASGILPAPALGAPLTAVAIVLYQVASVEPRRRSVPALAASIGAVTVSVLASGLVIGPSADWDGVVGLAFGWLALAAGWTIGLTTRVRREYTDRTAAQLAQQAVAEERLRIARELHDIVAHSMSLIAVKAGIGNHVAEQHPEEARAALRVIEATSRSSLTEMRYLLGVLRSEVDSPALTPAPSQDGIPALVDRAARQVCRSRRSWPTRAGCPTASAFRCTGSCRRH